MKISLGGVDWEVDEQRRLGAPGGFGEVFEGSGPAGPVAIKRLTVPIDEAHRELRIAAELVGAAHEHVIQIHASGEFQGRFYVVMARADRSLASDISQGGLPEVQALDILSQIVAGLCEVSSLVHRDLKPPNILFGDGRWKLADFGIAKFVEEATSARTVKDCLTPPYAAPEQWNIETCTHATDVYALGCIGYALLTGAPPFRGTPDQLRTAHLTAAPPELSSVSPATRSFLMRCLSKSPAARPDLSVCPEALRHAANALADGGRRSPIADAAAWIEQEQAAQAAKRSAEQLAREERERIASDGARQLEQLRSQLFDRIKQAAPQAQRAKDVITLGQARLRFEILPVLEMRRKLPSPGNDIACGAFIAADRGGLSNATSANLWFVDAGRVGRFRIVETTYTDGRRNFGIQVSAKGANTRALVGRSFGSGNRAASKSQHQVAQEHDLEGDGEEAFFQRWEAALARHAAPGKRR